jgi:endoglucanase
MFLPVGEVGATEAIVERLIFVLGGICWVDVVAVLEDVEFGVGVVAGKYGVARSLDHEGENCSNHLVLDYDMSMSLRIAFVAGFGLILAGFSFGVLGFNEQSVIDAHGRLQVKGNRIVDKNGKLTSLAGVSLFWSQWIGKYYTPEVVGWLKKDFKASIVRVAVGVEPDGYLAQPDVELKRAVTVIDAAIEEGVYVIVDWHDHAAQKHTAESVKFFGTLAKKYAGKPNVIYEIYNEPVDVKWGEIKPYAETVIGAIREHDLTALVIVGTPNWCQDVEVAAADPIDDLNVAYTLHFYAAGHKGELRAKAQKALDMGIPLFVTEYGVVNYDGDGPVDRESSTLWYEFMRKNGLSHCVWSLSDKVEGAAILKPGGTVNGGWSLDELTDSGRYVREIIRGWGG